MHKNIGCFEAVWMFFWNFIKNSLTYRLIRRVYDCISSAWRKSRIIGFFRHLHFDETSLKKSLAGRFVRSPFTFVEFLQNKYGDGLNSAIDKSGIFTLCRALMNNILGLNLRFIGIFLCFSAIGIFAGQAVCRNINYFSLVFLVAGLVLTPFDINVTEYLKNSALCRLICKLLGIEPDFEWFDNKYTTCKIRLYLSGAIGLVAGFAGGFASPLIIPLAIIGITAVLVIIKNPSAGAFALVFAAPLVPTMAAVGLSLLCLFSLLLHAVRTKGFRFKFDGTGFFIILFIAVYLIAGITSFSMMKSLSIWAIYFAFMTMYFVIINSVNTEKLLRGILVCFVLSGLFVCLYGIAQYLFGWNTTQAWMDEDMFSDIKMRIYSTLGNPNVLGEYILLVLPVSIGLMWINKNPASKIVYAGISAVMFAALILTFSRGCWIGILFAAVIFITFAAGKLWGLGLLALPVLPMVLPESIINRFASIGDMKDSSTSYRVYIWMGTLSMIKDFWVSGIGMGQEAFTQVYPFYSYNGIVAPHSHNLFLQILVESGIAGIAVFLLIIFFYLRKVMVGYQVGGKGDAMSTMMTAITAGICGFLVQGMFDNSFYNYRVMLVFWCTLAIGRACVYVAEQRRESNDKGN